MTPKNFRDAKMTEELRSTPNGLVIDWSRVKNDSKNYAVPPSCLFTIGRKTRCQKTLGELRSTPHGMADSARRRRRRRRRGTSPCARSRDAVVRACARRSRRAVTSRARHTCEGANTRRRATRHDAHIHAYGVSRELQR